MKLNIILSAALLAATSLFSAHASEGEPIDAAELQQQLEQARQDLAEAAQRMARLQRELIEGEGSQAWLQKSEGGQLQDFELNLDIEVSPERVRHLSIAGFPPRLGVLLDQSRPEDSNRVIGVTPGSGAEKAGIQQGDRLVSIEGQDVSTETSRRISELLRGLKPGDSVDVMVQRGDHSALMMPVTVGSALQDMTMMGERMAPMLQDLERHLIRIDSTGTPPMPPLPPSLSGLGGNTHLISNHLGLKPYFGTAEGILVLHIDEDNSLNLQSGDVVLKVDGDSINRPVDFGRSLLNREHGEAIRLQVMRQGALTEVDGLVPEQALPGSGARRIEVIRHRVEPDVS